MQSLYQRVLGAKFADLHPVLRRFHSSPTGTGRGLFRVTHSAGWLRKLLAAVMRMPREGEAIEVSLDVSPRGTGELWVRGFPGSPFVTTQTARRGLLMERSGPVCFGFALDAVSGGMTFAMREFTFVGFALPLWAVPSVAAVVVPHDNGWTVTVRMRLPLVGQLLEYHGEVIPRWT